VRLNTVVDFYRSRWVIEEFFKALKSGCAFEPSPVAEGTGARTDYKLISAYNPLTIS
jgi:hypothetical protein